MSKIKNMDMTNGSIFKKLFLFALPFMIMNVCQMLFNMADVAIVGIFVDDNAVAAVSSNASLINLIISLFVGMSVASNIITSRCVGAKDSSGVKKVIGTSIVSSIIFGIFLAIVGVIISKYLLVWMDCPPGVLPLATLYLKIYFLGMPIIMLYNFTSAILRALGDTTRPMIFILIAGAINVGLNVFFVAVCDLSVAGVAIATVISQGFSAVACLITILKQRKALGLEKSDFKIDLSTLKEIARLGIPSGIQSSLFSLSNVVIQSAINGFGESFVTANGIASQFDNVIHTMGDAVSVSAISFISSNYGARKYKRIVQSILVAIALIVIVDLSLASVMIIFGEGVCSIFTDTPEVVKMAMVKVTILGPCYVICNVMGTFANAFKGLGKPIRSMIICLIGSCLLRIVYVKLIFPINPTDIMLYLVYPITWLITLIALGVFLLPVLKKVKKELTAESNNQ